MKKKTPVNGRKLKLAKETITVLDDQQISHIKGGNQETGPDRSTRYDFTCTWCTTVLPDPDDQQQ
jgi:hypothetical protein